MRSLCKVDSSKFSELLPWIGLYIAGASFLCCLLMGLDTFLGFRSRKLWFPCRFLSLNATSLTLLSVATKLPVDLNTSMPGAQDQLTKVLSFGFIRLRNCLEFKEIRTSCREMGSGRSMAISPRFSFSLFLLALVMLSHGIMVAHCQQSCSLASCYGGVANEGCCRDIADCITSTSCAALCGICASYNIKNEHIKKCYYDWKFAACKGCTCT